MKRILTLILLICVGFVFAQQPYKKEDLRKKSKQLTNQIAKLNKSLNKSKSGSKKSVLYIKSLEEKIKAQRQLVTIATKERKVLEDEIYLSQLQINKLKRELSELKKEYKDVLVNTYKNKGLQNKVLFVLSSKSFTEAFRRIKYLEKYSGFQGEKADEIAEKRKAIEVTIASRKNAIKEKEAVLAKQQVMRENLEVQRKEQNNILAEFRKNEGEIRKEIANKKSENKKLEAEIQKIIDEEIRIAREKAEAERKRREEEARKERERLAKLEAERKAKLEAERKEREARERAQLEKERLAKIEAEKKGEAEKIAKIEAEQKRRVEEAKAEEARLAKEEAERKAEDEKLIEAKMATPEATLGASFVASKGSLPWPVGQGKLVGEFGKQPNIYLPKITMDNSGVLIATAKGASARAVYNGKVASVMQIPGGKTAVLVAHGTYFTVYYNLEAVFVKKGDTVSTKQNLGRIYTDSDNNTILNFHVWKGNAKQNPANWITGM